MPLALFGAAPLFDGPKPIGQLASPTFATFVHDLHRVRTERGTVGAVRQLEERLSVYHGVENVVAVANAGLGLIMLMEIFAEGRSGDVIMPAFSFRGLPHFAQWAGQMPYFCDITGPTHGLDPDDVRDAKDAGSTSILAVNNFNGPCEIEALIAVAAELEVPLFFDSVYGVGGTYGGTPLGGNGRAEVFSTHATKLLNGFEGGYVTTNDALLAKELRSRRETDIDCSLSGVHAHMALLSLDEVPNVIERNESRYRHYQKLLRDLPGLSLVPYAGDGVEKHNFEMAVVEVDARWPLTRDETVRVLRAENVLIAPYYSPPLHRGPYAPKGITQRSLPESEAAATRYVQLPVGELMTLEDIDRLADFLHDLARDGNMVARKLRQAS